MLCSISGLSFCMLLFAVAAVLAIKTLGCNAPRPLRLYSSLTRPASPHTDNHSHQSSFYCLYRVVCTTSSLLITHKASQSLTDNHSHQSSFYCLYRAVCTTSSLLITHRASQSLTDNHSHQSSFYCLYRVVCTRVLHRFRGSYLSHQFPHT